MIDSGEQDLQAIPRTNAYQDERTIRRVLDYARTVAIVGLSDKVIRASYFVGYYLSYRGYRVIPVNPTLTALFGEQAYPSLDAIPFKVDVVDVFRDPRAVPGIAEQAVQIGARALWLQFGVLSAEGAQIASDGGLDVVMDRCMKVEHARFLGQMHWFGMNTGVVSSKRQKIRWGA